MRKKRTFSRVSVVASFFLFGLLAFAISQSIAQPIFANNSSFQHLNEVECNPLLNGGFEDGLESWTSYANTSIVSGRTGNALAIHSPFVFQRIETLPNQGFKFTGYVRTEGDFGQNWTGLGVDFLASDTETSDISIQFSQPINDWQSFTIEGVTPSNTSAISIWLYSSDGVSLLVDDLVLEWKSCDPSATPTPVTPEPTDTPTPTVQPPTETPVTPDPTDTPDPGETPTPTAQPPTETPVTPEPTDTPDPGETPTPTPDTPTLTPTPTESPEPPVNINVQMIYDEAVHEDWLLGSWGLVSMNPLSKEPVFEGENALELSLANGNSSAFFETQKSINTADLVSIDFMLHGFEASVLTFELRLLNKGFKQLSTKTVIARPDSWATVSLPYSGFQDHDDVSYIVLTNASSDDRFYIDNLSITSREVNPPSGSGNAVYLPLIRR